MKKGPIGAASVAIMAAILGFARYNTSQQGAELGLLQIQSAGVMDGRESKPRSSDRIHGKRVQQIMATKKLVKEEQSGVTFSVQSLGTDEDAGKEANEADGQGKTELPGKWEGGSDANGLDLNNSDKTIEGEYRCSFAFWQDVQSVPIGYNSEGELVDYNLNDQFDLPDEQLMEMYNNPTFLTTSNGHIITDVRLYTRPWDEQIIAWLKMTYPEYTDSFEMWVGEPGKWYSTEDLDGDGFYETKNVAWQDSQGNPYATITKLNDMVVQNSHFIVDYISQEFDEDAVGKFLFHCPEVVSQDTDSPTDGGETMPGDGRWGSAGGGGWICQDKGEDWEPKTKEQMEDYWGRNLMLSLAAMENNVDQDTDYLDKESGVIGNVHRIVGIRHAHRHCTIKRSEFVQMY